MTSRTGHSITSARIVLFGAFLALGLGSGYQTASACYAPILDGSGYESQCTTAVDYPVLTGSGYDGHSAVAVLDPDTASTDEHATTSGLGSIDSVLIGSGYEGHAAVTMAEAPIAPHGTQPR